jgi:hypothetical protein
MVGRTTPGWGPTLAVLAALALPSPAMAGPLVPPGNSAVNQYTETYPSGGGDRHTRKPDGASDRSAAQVLGPRKARRLEARGEAGQAVATLVAATAPQSAATATGGGQPRGGGADAGGAAGPSGSSGLGQILGQATGLSAGGPGPLLPLPLAILATALWTLAYLWRRNRPT